jgi:ribonuclease H / adenosylcobalamin/alpha-ribazole phosphatase
VSEPEPTLSGSPRPKRGLYTLNADGGVVAESGRSAGEAAIGVVLKDSDNSLVEAISQPIGRVEGPPVAEFRALIEGLKLARLYGVDKIRVFLDSELVVNSVAGGAWELRPLELVALRAEADALLDQFADVKVSWVPREMNTEADLLASLALPPRRLRDAGPPAPPSPRA